MAGSVDTESTKSLIRSKPISLQERPKLTPRSTAKRLPWLGNKTSRAVTSTPLDGQVSSAEGPCAESPSSSTRLTYRNLSVAPAPGSAGPSTPTVRRKSMALPPQRRPSAVGSSPSPVTRHRLSQVRRAPVAPKTLSPLRTAHRASVSHAPQKRLSIVHHDDNESGSSSLYDARTRANSLAPVPDHLEQSSTSQSSTSDSIDIPHDAKRVSKSPPIVSIAELAPSQPAPGRNAFERIGDRRISNAVEDLEGMVQEAVEIAEDAKNRGQVKEIYDIIEEAKNAVRDASGEPKYLMTTAAPLAVSESSGISRFSSLSDHLAPPGPLAHVEKNILDNVAPDVKISMPRASVSYDWAYQHPKSREKDGPSTSSSTSSSSSSDRENERRPSNFGTRSDLLLPKLAQTAPRDHVDFVLRPVGREESRGRTRRRITDDTPHKRHRHRRSHNSESPSRPRRQDRSVAFSETEPSFDEEELPAKSYGNQLTVRGQTQHHTFSLRRHHRRQPIARNWSTGKKRLTAVIACINTALLGIIVGIYAGEVPRIQYYLADERHIVIVGNAVLYAGLAISTFFAWTLPLLHGRKPYVLAALAIALPLQFPQAVVVSTTRSPNNAIFRTGLMVARAASGFVLGFANVNYITVLLDLFGASLQSKNPHQEFVVANDVRRHGGGMGMWLGIWSWCWIGSLAVGFQVGAAVIESLTPEWGFYIVVIILACSLVLNIIAPETRRAPFRRSITEVYDRDENYITRRVSRGEVKLHISTEGPKYWFEEVWAGIKLMTMMLCQPGFLVLALYLGWIYAQIVLVIVLLGALLSRDYRWRPSSVGAGVMSIAVGAFFAIPLTKARIFSRERKIAFRTDSMTFQKQVTWSSHLIRRAVFTLTLPLMGLAYTLSSAGRPRPYILPIIFAGTVGFFSILAIAECHGLMMETFDTCDLQPGVNTRHRLQSMAVQDRRRRTNYTSFPRVTAGIFASQTIAFILAAVATMVGGFMTRRLGAQTSTGVTACILLGLTILLITVLWRFKEVQVIPNHTFGTRRDTAAWQEFKDLEKVGRGNDWKAVVIGNPSGKMRRMSVLELGSLSRWTEIRKLNFLIKGTMLGQAKEEDKKNMRSNMDIW
ncbi:hypothetical protein EJ02DRAFT_373362 [Clathrospora elynae]|uniref:MFS general substrate transporter n=1 Tax=Clathrospora elynae TaxID=706981 RepID=A0A6A5SSK6_9PLEO|nr:hypothetical protein EJ02DRAFT_373362 [Clathrospora elynae]